MTPAVASIMLFFIIASIITSAFIKAICHIDLLHSLIKLLRIVVTTLPELGSMISRECPSGTRIKRIVTDGDGSIRGDPSPSVKSVYHLVLASVSLALPTRVWGDHLLL